MKGKTGFSGMILTASVCWGELSCTKHASFALQTSFGQNHECGSVVGVINTLVSPRGVSSAVERLWLGQARGTC